MRTLSREEAIAEFGLRYSPSLDGITLELDRPRDPVARLLSQLNKLSGADKGGKIRIVEDLGSVTETFHFKSPEDALEKMGREQLEQYRKAAGEIDELLSSSSVAALVRQDAISSGGGKTALSEAFARAQAASAALNTFLASDAGFTVEVIRKIDNTLTVPDIVAKPGDIVFVVENKEGALPRLHEGTVTKADLHHGFLGKPDFNVSYNIDTGETPAPSGRPSILSNEPGYISPSAKRNAPNLVASGKNRLVFNSEAAAVKHLNGLLDEREAAAQETLEAVRAMRRQYTPAP